jgi:hypothetical protein
MRDYSVKRNLRIYNDVFNTDPSATKKINFGTPLTTIKAYFMFRVATQVFGPAGSGWGLDKLKVKMVFLDHPAVDETKTPAHTQQMAILTGRLFWRESEDSKKNHLMQIASIPVWTWSGKKRAMVLDDEALKKCQTDLTKKALSHLGFSNDIFMNVFADDKYIDREELEAQLIDATGLFKKDAKTVLEYFESLQNTDDSAKCSKTQIDLITKLLPTLVPEGRDRGRLMPMLFGDVSGYKDFTVAQAQSLITWIGATGQNGWTPSESAIQHVSEWLKLGK